MAVNELLDSRVSVSQCDKAVNALYEYATKAAEKEAETELLGAKEQHIWLNVTVKKIPAEHKLKPVKLYVSFYFVFVFDHN
jgi:ribosome biogenesis protein UTP30